MHSATLTYKMTEQSKLNKFNSAIKKNICFTTQLQQITCINHSAIKGKWRPWRPGSKKFKITRGGGATR